MGWTGNFGFASATDKEMKDHVESYWKDSEDYTLLKTVKKSTTYYMAVREESTGKVFPAITLTKRYGDEFLTKEMSGFGSVYYNDAFPPSIFKMCTPPEITKESDKYERECYEYYLAVKERVEKNREKRAILRKAKKDGSLIRLTLRGSNGEEDKEHYVTWRCTGIRRGKVVYRWVNTAYTNYFPEEGIIREYDVKVADEFPAEQG